MHQYSGVISSIAATARTEVYCISLQSAHFQLEIRNAELLFHNAELLFQSSKSLDLGSKLNTANTAIAIFTARRCNVGHGQ
jgi:hypothetical protein